MFVESLTLFGAVEKVTPELVSPFHLIFIKLECPSPLRWWPVFVLREEESEEERPERETEVEGGSHQWEKK